MWVANPVMALVEAWFLQFSSFEADLRSAPLDESVSLICLFYSCGSLVS